MDLPQGYSKQDVCRMLSISDRQLRSWQRRGFVPSSPTFTFADLIALRTLQKLRENGVPPAKILRAIESLKAKLSHVERPLSQLKIVCEGGRLAVQESGQRMEAITGQMLFDFDTADLGRLTAFPVGQPPGKTPPPPDPREAEHWFQKGLELEEGGAPLKDAIQAYRKAVEINPNAAGALVNLGTIYFHMRRYREAQTYYERAVAADPRYPLAHFNVANLYEEMGRLEMAREHYLTALRLNPHYADAHYNLALLAERRGDLMGAARHWRAYLKIDPSSSWADIARRQLEKLKAAAVVRGGGDRTATLESK
jgi:tetratricopeptide (TPR) repeat protein